VLTYYVAVHLDLYNFHTFLVDSAFHPSGVSKSSIGLSVCG